MPRLIALALLVIACTASPAWAQQAARNVTGNNAEMLSRWRCLGSYDLTPNRLAPERARLGQGALRLAFAIEGGLLTARVDRAPGIEPFREPAGARKFESLGKATSLAVTNDRLVFSAPGGAEYDLKIARTRLAGTVNPQDIPQFKNSGYGTVRLECAN